MNSRSNLKNRGSQIGLPWEHQVLNTVSQTKILIRSFFDKDLVIKISDKNEGRFDLSEVIFKFK